MADVVNVRVVPAVVGFSLGRAPGTLCREGITLFVAENQLDVADVAELRAPDDPVHIAKPVSFSLD